MGGILKDGRNTRMDECVTCDRRSSWQVGRTRVSRQLAEIAPLKFQAGITERNTQSPARSIAAQRRSSTTADVCIEFIRTSAAQRR
jgi:hypothetical protein